VRVGYSAKLAHSQAAARSSPGSFSSLRHTFVTVALDGEDYVVDPAFRDHFLVHRPAARYASVLDAIPQVAVAPAPRLARAVTFLAAEVAACFVAQGVPLPPWRKTTSLLSKWDSPAGAQAGAPTTPRQGADVARFEARRRVANKLALLGVASDFDFLSPASRDGASPSSVLPPPAAKAAAVHPAHVVQLGFQINECFCCGWRQTLRQLAMRRWDVAGAAAA
jgi:uncharacterized protein (TIGR01615 family)